MQPDAILADGSIVEFKTVPQDRSRHHARQAAEHRRTIHTPRPAGRAMKRLTVYTLLATVASFAFAPRLL